MQLLEVSCAVRRPFKSLGFKGLNVCPRNDIGSNKNCTEDRRTFCVQYIYALLIRFYRRRNALLTFINWTSLIAWWSELLTINHEVPGSIPGSTMCVFP